MNWSRYSFLEKLKIIVSICKGHSTNIVNVAMHTQNINLAKKMLEVEEMCLKDTPIVDLIHHGIIKYEKYHLFFKVLMDKINQVDNKDLVITPQIELILKGYYVDIYNFSDSGSITNDTDFIIQNSNPVHAEEETLGFYIRTKKQNSDIERLKTKEVNVEHSDLNYAQLDLEYYQKSLDCYLDHRKVNSVLGDVVDV